MEDCIVSLWNIGIQGDELFDIYELNKRATVTVKTSMGKTESFEQDNLVKQGTVLGPIICGASTAEFSSERGSGGVSVGTMLISTLAHVDDIANVNTELEDVRTSHENLIWFSKKKRLDLSTTKCKLLPVNVKPCQAIPVLEIEDVEMEIVKMFTYLGDIINSKGNNSDLIADRVAKGKAIIVRSQSLCGISMGIHSIEILLVMYQFFFLSGVLYNCQAWNRLTIDDLNNLQSIQLKYLKKVLFAPRATSNAAVFMDLGILPIEHEINIRRLSFLHHIICLDDKDPVRKAYNQQKMYPAEGNWQNEMQLVLTKYELKYSEAEIREMTKRKWMALVKNSVHNYALKMINMERVKKGKSSLYPEYKEFKTKEFLVTMPPNLARLVFKLRAGLLDIKDHKSYKFEDKMCRLCGEGVEDVNHILNVCQKMPNKLNVNDFFDTTDNAYKSILNQIDLFYDMVDSIDS